MSGMKHSGSSVATRRSRKIKVAPVTRAVRMALAASVAALALGASGGAFAGDCKPTTVITAECAVAKGIDTAPVVDLTIVDQGIAPIGTLFAALAIDETDIGDVIIDNADPITEIDLFDDVTAIRGYSSEGNVGITNQAGADLYAGSVYGSAIGIYAYAAVGDAAVDNAADITAISYYGLADGIFASGADVDVTNAGAIEAEGSTWAAGIEAQGSESVTVDNSGDISATAAPFVQVTYDGYTVGSGAVAGQAFGIYATGGEAGAEVTNSGNITVEGYYATGIEVQSSGDIVVDNSGNIAAGSGLHTYYNPGNYYTYYYGTAVATGINATSNGEGAHVGVSNSGDISADGIFGATGIAATSGGLYGSASVSNSGDITVSQNQKYGYGAYGIAASADGDASIDNSGGVEVYSAGAASGLTALSFAGDASVTNAGDIAVESTAALSYSATGIVAFAGNGNVSVDNSGSVDATAKYWASGINASGYGDVTVSNSGTVYANGEKYAFGVYAVAAAGDVVVNNAEGGEIGFYSYSGRGWGVFGYASQGDVNLSNGGSISGYAYGQSSGLFGRAAAGDVSIVNTGAIEVDSRSGAALGVFARADNGTAAVDNSGTIDAYSYANVAYGMLAQGAYAVASNSGSIIVDGVYATGILADGYYGATVTSTGGSIEAFGIYGASGIVANSAAGDAVVVNAATITASSRLGAATGLMSSSGAGNASVENTGEILAASLYGPASGIISYSLGYDASVANAGTIAVYSRAEDATGIVGASGYGNVAIGNSGYVVANSVAGDAIGIYGYSVAGDVAIENSGDLYVESAYGLADGIFASGANVSVDNSGDITAIAPYWAAGIEAQGANSVEVTNTGDIVALAAPFMQVVYGGSVVGSGSVAGQAFGIYATAGEGGASVANSGDITVEAYYATGIEVQSGGDILVANSGNIIAGSGLHEYYNPGNYYTYYYGAAVATGINATSNGEGAHVGVSNSGDISADGIFGATGIAATSGGLYGSASVSNSGDISATQYVAGGYGAFGIFATADGDVSIDTSGAITVASGGTGYGAAALSFAGDATIVNSGDVSVDAGLAQDAFKYYGSYGLLAFAGNGTAAVDNSGTVAVSNESILASPTRAVDAQGQQGALVNNSGSLHASGYYAYGVFATSSGGDVSVHNSGTVYAEGRKYAFGVYAVAATGDVSVGNAEGGEIGFYSYGGRGWGVFGYASQGDVEIGNAGIISGYAFDQSSGVFGRAAAGDVTIGNSGTIEVISGDNVAVGVFARADNGTATVVNSGDITASVEGLIEGYVGYSAYGIFARGGYAQVANSGDITAIGSMYATGIAASSLYGTTISNSGGSIVAGAAGLAIGIDANSVAGDVTVGNASNITAAGAVYGATAIQAVAINGDVTVGNSGELEAASLYGNAVGIYASGAVDIVVNNSGKIVASSEYGGMAIGILAMDAYSAGGYLPGTTTVVNSGDMELTALYPGFGKAIGINADRVYGDVIVGNSGNIDIYAMGRSYGVYAHVIEGNVAVTNTGDITMMSPVDAQIGLSASTGIFFFGGGNASVKNSGDLDIHSDYGIAVGMQAIAGSVLDPHGDSYVLNTGDVDVFGQYFAYGIQTRATSGDALVINTGDVNVTSNAYFNYVTPGKATGIAALNLVEGSLTIQNSGDVTVHGYVDAYGLYAKAEYLANVTITNTGDVSVASDYGIAQGVFGFSLYGDVTINNGSAGHIEASGGIAAVGVHGVSLTGDVTVNNAGTIHAGDSGHAAAIVFEGFYGTNTVNNLATGVISAEGDVDTAYAVVGSDAVEIINNSGRITGALSLYGGNDILNNRSGGVWDTDGTWSTDFGDGDDVVNNFAGGTILLDDSGIYLGGSVAGNTFVNAGTIKARGESLIHMGTGLSAPANPLPLHNIGIIDFLDDHTDDSLTIVGDLGGNGSLNIDLDLSGLASDQLYVEGNMVNGAAQRVNVDFDGMPLTAHASVAFAHVSGTSSAGSFVAGQMIGYNEPANFLDLDLTVSSQLNAANTADDVFSINLDVVGLNDTGTLAANVASGAAGMLNAQVGTFKQRMGVNPYGDAGKVMSAFFRTYTSEGDVNPDHLAANFGQGGNFGYDQSVWGREVGVNANLFGNFHAGLTFGSADGRQRLTGAGVGSNRMDGMTWGLYATWFAPQGFYVDVSGRWMAVDVTSSSAAGQNETRAHTGAWNLEAGYQWTLGGLSVVPQLQYTRTEVEDVRTLHGQRATFEGHGGTSERARLGVEISKTFQSGNVRWTPYGSINAIREFDGEMTYTVADNFFGSTRTEGSSAMAELGLGVQTGGWGFTIGANWIDGGAIKSTVGGQAVVRFAW